MDLQKRVVRVGIDIGSLYLKVVAQTEDSHFIGESAGDIFGHRGNFYFFKPVPVKGRPLAVAAFVIEKLYSAADGAELIVQFTGSQAQRVARLLDCPWVNEFKALARGCVGAVPETRTILEIGGDGSRFLQVEWNAEKEELSILDYSRNGECAAGTGSFIDQQAARMNYRVEEIGRLVIEADGCANIAGRCSVFAKSDMVHAQQRGYAPGAIFKGLCEAVVRNFKGTVVRGRTLTPLVVMAGGVALNEGVVQAVKSIFAFQENDFRVVDFPQHVSALGCALLPGGAQLKREALLRLTHMDEALMSVDSAARPPLNTERVRRRLPRRSDGESLPQRAYLGIDVGSVSTNLALLDEEGRVIDEVYTRTEGKPIQVVQRELAEWGKKYGGIEILGVGTTGSGRELIGELVGADAVHDEITAHKTAACTLAEQEGEEPVDTIFEIGGQDSKFISLEDGVVVDFAMNEACAAGTGSFLEEQAAKLGISIQRDFARLALESANPIRLGERCTVFMEKDVGVFMQQGRDLRDICAGLAYAVVYNYLNRVVRDRKIGNRIYFQGGTAYNLAVAAAFSMVLDREITVPPHNGVLGAVGAA
ncbi:MAG: acyl-CoA dehydratase activase, partial [candidate division KSB1 bacterium]|nr:acyl-CoA dehydratase activase [candidate division KSB1 bacterium]